MLISLDFYQRTTGDTASSEDEVTDLVYEAIVYLQDELDRWLIAGEYTETVVIHPDRRAYPKAYPVTVAPTGAEIDPEMGGRAIRDVSPDDTTWTFGHYDHHRRPAASITYTGGYTDTDGDGPYLPSPLARCVAQLAAALRAPATAGVLAGATSVRLGDAGVTLAHAAGDLDELVPGITARLRRYRRREYP